MRRVLAGMMILALGACERRPSDPSAPPPEPTPGPTPTSGSPISYQCEGGQTVTARYPDSNTAVVTWEGRNVTLTIAQSASGARYVGEGLEWWTATRDGQETGRLSRGGGAQPASDLITRCSSSRATTEPAAMTLPAGSATVCVADDLRLSRTGGDARAGERMMIVGLRNAGLAACAVIGYPTVRLLDREGQVIASVRAQNTPHNSFSADHQPEVVTLASSGRASEAYFDIAWSAIPAEHLGETECPSAARVEVRLPGDDRAVTLASSMTPCGRRIRVSPLRAEAAPGAPAHRITPAA